MVNRPEGDVWNIIDNDKESMHYGRNYKFDFSYIKNSYVRNLYKDYIWENYRAGNKVLKSLYDEIHCYFNRFYDYMTLHEITCLRDLTNSDVDNYISYLRTTVSKSNQKPLSYLSQKKCLDVLKAFIYWCQLHKPDDVPATEIFTGSEFRIGTKLRIDFIPDEIVERINRALIVEENPYLKYGIIIMQSTGMRVGDLIKLRIDCIKPHLINGYTIEWFQHKGRTNKNPMPVRSECVVAIEKLIELTSEFREMANVDDKQTLMIWQAPRTDKYMKKGEVRAIKQNTFATKWFRNFVKKNDIRDSNGNYYNLTSHQFRRTLGTDMLSKGIDINVIREVLGHSSPSVTKRFYADVKDKERAEMFKGVGVIGNINQIQSSAFDSVSEFEWFKANKNKSACMLYLLI